MKLNLCARLYRGSKSFNMYCNTFFIVFLESFFCELFYWCTKDKKIYIFCCKVWSPFLTLHNIFLHLQYISLWEFEKNTEVRYTMKIERTTTRLQWPPFFPIHYNRLWLCRIMFARAFHFWIQFKCYTYPLFTFRKLKGKKRYIILMKKSWISWIKQKLNFVIFEAK